MKIRVPEKYSLEQVSKQQKNKYTQGEKTKLGEFLTLLQKLITEVYRDGFNNGAELWPDIDSAISDLRIVSEKAVCVSQDFNDFFLWDDPKGNELMIIHSYKKLATKSAILEDYIYQINQKAIEAYETFNNWYKKNYEN